VEIEDRQLDAVLDRLAKIGSELERLNARLDRDDMNVIARELKSLNESLSALAYAALGQQGPQVRRRGAG
jgi:hypothetical protein